MRVSYWAALATLALGTGTVLPAVAQRGTGAKTAAPAAAGSAILEVVGSVNGKPITLGQVLTKLQQENAKAFSDMVGQVIGSQAADTLFGAKPKPSLTLTKEDVLKAVRKQPPPLVANQLQTMLTIEAMNQQAAKEKVTPNEADITTYTKRVIQEARKTFNVPDTTSDEQFVTSRGTTMAKLRENMRSRKILMNLVQKDAEKAQGRPYGPDDFLQARHILVRVETLAPDAKEEDKKKADETAKAKATKLLAEVKEKKKTFEAIAQESSDDPGSKTRGGDLGVFTRARMDKDFSDAAFALKPGQVSDLVKTQFGYHIIEVTKLGKDISAEERQQNLETFLQGQLSVYLSQLTTTLNKVENKIPMQAPTGPMGMAPGGPRPNMPMPRPGVRPPTPRPIPSGGGTPGNPNNPPKP